MEQGLASVETGLLEVRKNNEPIKGMLVFKRTTSIKIEGAGCIVAYRFRNKFKINIDGKTSEIGLRNSSYTWVCMPYSCFYANDSRYYVKDSDIAGSIDAYQPRYNYNGFVKPSQDSFGLQPIRFDRLLEASSESDFDIIYALDPT